MSGENDAKLAEKMRRDPREDGAFKEWQARIDEELKDYKNLREAREIDLQRDAYDFNEALGAVVLAEKAIVGAIGKLAHVEGVGGSSCLLKPAVDLHEQIVGFKRKVASAGYECVAHSVKGPSDKGR